MILRELYELYKRLLAAGEAVPGMGRSLLPVSFRIILKPNGELVRIEDARTLERTEKKDKKGQSSVTETLVPTYQMLLGNPKPSGSGLNPCFLWDNAGYMLGYVSEKDADKASRIRSAFEHLRGKHLEHEARVENPAYSAVCRFLSAWVPESISKFVSDTGILSHQGVFRIQGESADVHDNEAICRWWNEAGRELWWGGATNDSPQGICLVTNEPASIARLHEPSIKGVVGAQSTGAKLVSFNCKSFESYGREQSANAPVSEEAAFGYCNALNYLLAGRMNRVRVGETTVVFWADAARRDAFPMEMLAWGMMNPHELEHDAVPAQDMKLVANIRTGLQQLAQGKPLSDTSGMLQDVRFFILGLSPNAARLSVRFYRESTFGEFLQNLQLHYGGMSLVRRGGTFRDPEVISPFMILRESVRDVSKDLPPNVTGSLMNAIISGAPYPDQLAMSILRRFKADGNINLIRCAFLKAWLTRNHHINLNPMLDTTNTQPGYLLGRLFAALVKTQEDALGKNLNRDMRQSYYGSASAAPRSVFPRLMRLYTHHLSKLEGGCKVHRERVVQQIMRGLSDFPPHLTLAEQGCFSIGYYHQMHDFYTPNSTQQGEND